MPTEFERLVDALIEEVWKTSLEFGEGRDVGSSKVGKRRQILLDKINWLQDNRDYWRKESNQRRSK